MTRIQMFCNQTSIGLINLKSDPNMMTQSCSKQIYKIMFRLWIILSTVCAVHVCVSYQKSGCTVITGFIWVGIYSRKKIYPFYWLIKLDLKTAKRHAQTLSATELNSGF